MAANSSLQLTTLDFDSLKGSLIGFMKSQNTFKDYNFEGSALNSLIDLLAYNTQYNAYYLNMVANEMFLDSATQRASVVSHAKLLDYTPKSAIAPTATVNITFNSVGVSSLTLPAYSVFSSSAINGVNYTFVNPTSYTVNTVGGTATFNNVEIKQGVFASFKYVVNSTANPNYVFEIPDATIDTTTLQVVVQQSSTNNSYDVYNPASGFLSLDDKSNVYFLEESLNGNYKISFGDGVLGKKLTDGNIVSVKYLSTEGSAAAGANSFVLMQTVSGYSPSFISPVTPATQGGDKETIDSIKFSAPKTFASQGRAVTTDDYITAIQQNQLGFSFDAVTVWGGQDNNPPAYGQVFVSLKPTGGLILTPSQKQLIVREVIDPISVLTVSPTIIDPDYNFIQVNSNVLYDSKSTVFTSSQIQQLVISYIQQFASSKLNKFNSTFSGADLIKSIQNADPSIITNDTSIKLQKKFTPNLGGATTYNLYFNTPLKKGVLTSGVGSSPAMQFQDVQNAAVTLDGVYLEENPSLTGGISQVNLLNPGFNYTAVPTVKISGDGVGATAEATVVNGVIVSINVTDPGTNYTQAIVTITPAEGDTSGSGGSAIVVLEGQFGVLRTYYYNSDNVKTILNYNAGTIDYINGIITLTNFNPKNVDNELGILTISVTPSSTIINSSLNKMLSIDSFDPNAIIVNVTAKS